MLVRRLARPLLASIFLVGGAEALRSPKGHAGEAADAGAPKVAGQLGLPTDPDQLVRINAAAQVIGGLALATNRLPRLSALVLAGTLPYTTYAGHNFWSASDPQTRHNQQMHFVKNLSVLGGLLIAAADTEGRDSVARRTRRVTRNAARATKAGATVVPIATGHGVGSAAKGLRSVVPGR